jgi:ADP-ribosyl-[dinitrogen reductase] hydrolase
MTPLTPAGELDFEPGFEFHPDEAKVKWRGFLQEAAEHSPVHFENNGWVVAAFKAAASAVIIGHYDYTKGIEAAIRAGFDTDTVAAIAGSLLGAISGEKYLPEEWKEILHGWPTFEVGSLTELSSTAIRIG